MSFYAMDVAVYSMRYSVLVLFINHKIAKLVTVTYEEARTVTFTQATPIFNDCGAMSLTRSLSVAAKSDSLKPTSFYSRHGHHNTYLTKLYQFLIYSF